MNQAKLLPCDDYLAGLKLPPHFSPFVIDEDPSKVYVSAERASQIGGKSTIEVESSANLEQQSNIAKNIQVVSKRNTSSAKRIKKAQTNVEVFYNKTIQKAFFSFSKIFFSAIFATVKVNFKKPETFSGFVEKSNKAKRTEEAEQESLATTEMTHNEKYLYKKLKYRESMNKKLRNRILRKKLAKSD